MHSSVNAMLEIDFPLLAFTHCRDVVVEVSKARWHGCSGSNGNERRAIGN